ncbi:ergothioneine biosynthesis protein EgtB [Paraburkholderia sp. CNPSo 3157]|uniref:Ergothioneine biosynthesis protein EgtB n=1 Tax=Paraburkholderia franconis TaxID=2654983 RepID=A0A7X1TIT8_9BURK|nr:ergothioneine biosynthesis protein EgtB [Paraburkholderia franconis]
MVVRIGRVTTRKLDKAQLDAAFIDAHRQTWAILADLTPSQMQVPCDPGINPPLWEYAHVAWFTEHWILRDPQRGPQGRFAPTRPSLLASADRWFDSGRVAHDDRWHLDLPPLAEIIGYADTVLEQVRAKLAASTESDEDLYYFRLALYHEDMHAEALTYMRQTLDYPPHAPLAMRPVEHLAETSEIAIGSETFEMGGSQDDGFVFDNEKWRHAVSVGPAQIDRQCVSNAQFMEFVAANGYENERWWSSDGIAWLKRTGLKAPKRWREAAGAGARNGSARWEHRWFGQWQPLPLSQPVCHVNAYEAEAFCRWHGRRLPTEAEWEYAACNELIEWGESVWEWMADPFEPYAAFSADPYEDYSAPWFHSHRSVRGASFVTRDRMRNPRYRNFYLPHRSDIFVGFRTCR